LRLKMCFTLFALVLLVLTAWLLLSGVGGFGFQNEDYVKHNALLLSLILKKWPPTVGENANLVYYVAYYLPAALAGKILGWEAANYFNFLWTFTGIILSYLWFWKISAINLKNSKTRTFVLLLIFSLAGGLDVIGYYLIKHHTIELFTHIERWAKYFQYSSNTTLIYWVPQHTIAGWLLTGIVVTSIYVPQNLKCLGLSVAFGIIWSPFVVIGIAPFLIFIFIEYMAQSKRRYLYNFEVILLSLSSLWIGIINGLFIASNRYTFPVGFIWEFIINKRVLITSLLEFWFLEFAFLTVGILLLIVLGRRFSPCEAETYQRTSLLGNWKEYLKCQFNIDPTQLYVFLLAIVILTILPLFKMGYANDLVMRGSIPALFIFWAFVGKIAVDSSVSIKIKMRYLYILITAVIIIGFFSGITEISRSINQYHFGPPTKSSVENVENYELRKYIKQIKGDKTSIFYRFISK